MQTELLTKRTKIVSNQSMFLIRVNGSSMINAGIHSGDFILVDKKGYWGTNSIVIAEINGKWTVKKIIIKDNEIYLQPENPMFPPIHIKNDDDFKVIGTVVKVIKSFN
jgi:DNA polymerase V